MAAQLVEMEMIDLIEDIIEGAVIGFLVTVICGLAIAFGG